MDETLKAKVRELGTASMIVSAVCNYHRNSDLLAAHPDILAAFNERFDELRERATKSADVDHAALVESERRRKDLFDLLQAEKFRSDKNHDAALGFQDRALRAERMRDHFEAALNKIVEIRDWACYAHVDDDHAECSVGIARDALAARFSDPWAPIDTAPRGKMILTWAIVDTETGNWWMRISSYTEEPAKCESHWNGWGWGYEPTHWRPLPGIPSEEAAHE